MPEQAARRSRSGARILVIEPDGALRHVLGRALEDADYIVISTHDVGLARELLDAQIRIDLVVTNLPLDLGGHVSYLDRLEADFPTLPILHLTGPVFQGRTPFSEAAFSIPRFLAAVRHCLATGRCDPPPDQRRIA
jgi:DNA-binding NtrC family response regulator